MAQGKPAGRRGGSQNHVMSRSLTPKPMALENLTQQEVEALEVELLAKVPELGRIGNKSLRNLLLT